jgi:outer membrane protein W
MHKSAAMAPLLLFFSVAAFAQGSNSVSVFATDLAHSNIGSATVDAAYGASLDHMFTDRLSGELSVSSQRSRRYKRTFTASTEPTSVLVTYRLYPIDVNISYHFLNGSRWKPYIGAGLRYVNDTFQGYEGRSRTAFYHDAIRTIDREISGGITLQFNRMLGLRLDAKQALDSRSDVADSKRKVSVGLAFRF